ncbi:DUF4870 domain-containing protein [Algoriphagus resistens]|uniref:DUF4870 domain-containing protein n=1 Tax=Algoriphagus resistens TaxID=1750590 RepID=UPI000716927F|nr:DUF4870 domain-containing protein [Algoriphagus resistens]
MKHNLDYLIKLDDLVKKGIITEDEFNCEKDKILGDSMTRRPGNLFGLNENTYCFLLHIAVFLGIVHILLALVAPVVLWTLNRQTSQLVDEHGRNVVNWVLSFFIYATICFVVIFPGISHLPMNISPNFNLLTSLYSGLFPITILLLISIMFVFIGGLKASNGQIWKYPLAIPFFKR